MIMRTLMGGPLTLSLLPDLKIETSSMTGARRQSGHATFINVWPTRRRWNRQKVTGSPRRLTKGAVTARMYRRALADLATFPIYNIRCIIRRAVYFGLASWVPALGCDSVATSHSPHLTRDPWLSYITALIFHCRIIERNLCKSGNKN